MDFRCTRFLLFTEAFTHWRSSPNPSQMERRSCWPSSVHVCYMAVHSLTGFAQLISHWLAVLASNKMLRFFSRISFRLGMIMLNTKSILWGNCSPSLMSDSCPLSKYCPCSITQVINEKMNHTLGETDTCDSVHPPALAALPQWALSQLPFSQGALHRNFTQIEVSSLAFERLHRRRGDCFRLSFLHCSCERYFHKAAVIFVERKINTNKAQTSNNKAPRLSRFLSHAASTTFR